MVQRGRSPFAHTRFARLLRDAVPPGAIKGAPIPRQTLEGMRDGNFLPRDSGVLETIARSYDADLGELEQAYFQARAVAQNGYLTRQLVEYLKRTTLPSLVVISDSLELELLCQLSQHSAVTFLYPSEREEALFESVRSMEEHVADNDSFQRVVFAKIVSPRPIRHTDLGYLSPGGNLIYVPRETIARAEAWKGIATLGNKHVWFPDKYEHVRELGYWLHLSCGIPANQELPDGSFGSVAPRVSGERRIIRKRLPELVA